MRGRREPGCSEPCTYNRRHSQTHCAFAFLRYLYWVNQGQKGMRTIETAGMDGSDRKVLVVANMEEPVGLTLDHVTGRLYWISKYKQVLQRGQEGKVNSFSWGLG